MRVVFSVENAEVKNIVKFTSVSTKCSCVKLCFGEPSVPQLLSPGKSEVTIIQNEGNELERRGRIKLANGLR